MENNRDKLIDDLNSILKDNFDYVPLFKVINVADELIKRGWSFNRIMVDKECLDCKRYYSGSCDGVKDRNRENITIENCCSGYLQREQEHIKE